MSETDSQIVERDPRIDPIAGDVLQKEFRAHGYRNREVDEVTPKTVIYVGEDTCAPEISLRSWRKWAVNADIIKRGDVALTVK